MSNKINPASIHLGGDSPQYFAEYLPINPQDLPAACELPAALQLNLTPVPMVPLNESCEFQFPDVIPVPPVYNVPFIPPPSCETLTVTSAVTTCTAAKKSFLGLSSSGPTLGTDGATNECHLSLVGNICVDACESFSGKVSITFDTLSANSNLAIVSKNTPDCGFDLIGNIAIDACKTISVASNIRTCEAMGGSYITATASGPDSAGKACHINLDGYLCTDACTSFNADVYTDITGPVTSKGKSLVLWNTRSFNQSNTGPNCGFQSHTSIGLMACVDFAGSSKIKLNGAPWNKSSYIDFVSKGAPECGFELTGELTIDACKEFTVSNKATIKGSTKRPGIVTGSWVIAPAAATPPASSCGIEITGDIVVDSCNSMDLIVDNVGTGGKISVYNSAGQLTSSVNLTPTLVVTNGTDDCGKTIKISMADVSITVPSATNTAGGGGGVETTCYSCDSSTGCVTFMSLNTLEVTLIQAPSNPSCCHSTCAANINFCESTANIKSISTNLLEPADCCAGNSDNFLNLCDGKLQLNDSANNIEFTSGYITQSTGDVSSDYRAGLVTIEGGGGTFTLDAGTGTGTLKNMTGTTKIDGNTISVFSEACGGETDSFIYVDKVLPSDCCKDGKDNYLDMCGGTLYLASAFSPEDVSSSSSKSSFMSAGFVQIANSSGAGGPGGALADSLYLSADLITMYGGDVTAHTKIKPTEIRIQNGDANTYSALTEGMLYIKDTNGANVYIDTGTVNIAGENNTGGLTLDSSSLTIGDAGTMSMPADGNPDGPGDYSSGANTYIDSGSVNITPSGGKGGVTVDSASITIEDTNGKNVYIAVPDGKSASFQEISFCVDGTTKTAWVLMTTPE